MDKLKVGFYSFTSCEGCQIMVLNSQELFGELTKIIEVVRLPIIQQYNSEGPFDIVFLEGAITKPEQIKKIKEIREKTTFLIALGTCATCGGISARENTKKLELKETKNQIQTCKDFHFLENLNKNNLDKYAKIDYKIKGCPPTKEEFINLIQTIHKTNTLPKQYDSAVCIECRAKKNPCLLGQGHDCIGPITVGGCNALCPSKGIKCYGCRGPVSKPEKIDFLVKLFTKRGLTDEQITRRFSLFAGTPKRYNSGDEK